MIVGQKHLKEVLSAEVMSTHRGSVVAINLEPFLFIDLQADTLRRI